MPRQRRGVPGESRSATPSRVQAGRGPVPGAAGTGRAGPARLIRPHLYRHPCHLAGAAAGGQSRYPWPWITSGGEVPAMTGPGDQMAAGRGPMRASHADREQVIEALKDAFAHGLADHRRTRRADRPGAGRPDLRRAGRAHRRPPARPGRARAAPPADPGPAPAAGQGGRRVGRLPGPRGRRRGGQLHPRSGRPRRRSPLGRPDDPAGPVRRHRGSVDLVVRGGHLRAAATPWQAAAAPAGAGRPRPRRPAARRHRPRPGSPRPPLRSGTARSRPYPHGPSRPAWHDGHATGTGPPRHRQRLRAGRRDLHVIAGSQEPGAQLRGRADHMLAVDPVPAAPSGAQAGQAGPGPSGVVSLRENHWRGLADHHNGPSQQAQACRQDDDLHHPA